MVHRLAIGCVVVRHPVLNAAMAAHELGVTSRTASLHRAARGSQRPGGVHRRHMEIGCGSATMPRILDAFIAQTGRRDTGHVVGAVLMAHDSPSTMYSLRCRLMSSCNYGCAAPSRALLSLRMPTSRAHACAWASAPAWLPRHPRCASPSRRARSTGADCRPGR